MPGIGIGVSMALGRVGATFSPSSISGMIFYDLSDDSTLTITSAPDIDSATAVSDPGTGGTINGGSTKPHDVADGAAFSGVAGDNFVSSEAASYWTALHETGCYMAVVLQRDVGAANHAILDTHNCNASQHGVSLQVNAGDNSVWRVANGTGTPVIQVLKSSITTGLHFARMAWDASSGTYAIQFDNDSELTGSITGTPSSTAPSGTLTVGNATNGVSFPLDGTVHGFAVMNSRPTDDEIASMDAYIKGLYGI